MVLRRGAVQALRRENVYLKRYASRLSEKALTIKPWRERTMANLPTDSDGLRRENAPHAGSDPELFLQPLAGRMIASLADSQVQRSMRHHGSIARRIVLGRQVMRIAGKGNLQH
jgi:hypothetical protein